MELKVGDRIRVGELETVVESFRGIEGDEQFPLMIGTPYGEFHSDLVKKIEEITPENGLHYAEDYKPVDLNHFVGIVPIRKLKSNEELDGICQIRDMGTGIWYIGFTVKVWDTASLNDTIWIGSKLAETENQK